MDSISIVIVAQDEERTIGQVLKSVEGLACEIIFVDSGSTDSTVDIARSHGVKLYHQDWLGYAAQKNYALSLASSNWILSLDADEIVTPALCAEIVQKVGSKTASDFAGFKIPRLLYIGNRAIKHGGFYPDAQLRLFRRGAGQFNNRAVHEAVKMKGPVGRLKNPLLHFAYADIGQFKEAMDKYARLSAVEAERSGFHPWRLHPLNELLHPLWTFFYRFFLRGGILDGALGLNLTLIYSDYVRRKIVYLKDSRQAGSRSQ